MIDHGFDGIGCMMKLYENADVGIKRSRTCCTLEDIEDARSVDYKPDKQFCTARQKYTTVSQNNGLP